MLEKPFWRARAFGNLFDRQGFWTLFRGFIRERQERLQRYFIFCMIMAEDCLAECRESMPAFPAAYHSRAPLQKGLDRKSRKQREYPVLYIHGNTYRR